jgi:transitional endoplasmic reticulum ATPase
MPPFGFNSSDRTTAPPLRTGRRVVSDTVGASWGLGGQKKLLIGIGVLVATWWLMGLLGANRFAALGVSVAGLLLLPQPTPQFVLFASRMTVAVTGAMCLTIATGWPSSVFPGSASQWDKIMALPFWLGCGALLLWPFSTFMRRKGQEKTPGTANDSNDEKWAQVPAVRFEDVGGFNQQKSEMRIVAENRFLANTSSIVRNGVLLYGPQGTGKNFLAEATAGEFGANWYHVRCPQLLGPMIGSTTTEIRRAFDWARAHRPIVMFLDEIDAIGSKKALQGGSDSGGAGREYNTIVTQLMQSIDDCRNVEGLLILAATNHIDTLEPALIRDGRFDSKLRLDLPDDEGRKEVLLSLLKETRWRSHELLRVIRRTVGWSPARLKAMVDRCVLTSKGQPLSEEHLLATIEIIGGNDRPNLDPVHWDDVVLPADIVDEIKSLIRLMEPGESERLSIPPPTGLILVGAPGTGKTLTARLIASQVSRSFYAITPGEVLSGEVGGSVRRLKEVFARAKENAPSLLFFDEMDGLFPAPSIATGQHDVQLVEQGLIEISQLRPEHNVFLIGTSNFLERIDPRVLRGGRFSEKLHIGLPDAAGYRKLIARYLGSASLHPNLEIEMVFDRVRDLAPADLEATIQGMKRLAMRRMTSQHTALPPLTIEDLERALSRVRPPV